MPVLQCIAFVLVFPDASHGGRGQAFCNCNFANCCVFLFNLHPCGRHLDSLHCYLISTCTQLVSNAKDQTFFRSCYRRCSLLSKPSIESDMHQQLSDKFLSFLKMKSSAKMAFFLQRGWLHSSTNFFPVILKSCLPKNKSWQILCCCSKLIQSSLALLLCLLWLLILFVLLNLESQSLIFFHRFFLVS